MSPHDDLTDRLRRAGGSPDGGRSELDDLRRRLAAAADDDGLVQVGYRTVDSPLGRLLVAATGAGLVRVAFEAEDHDVVLQELADRIGPRVLRLPSRTDPVARQLDEYFAGRRHGFSVELDLQLVRGFRRDVVVGLADIPYGRTESYAQVAARAGRPSAVRAVGSACSHNPVPVVLPCHRVVRSDGSLGQYTGPWVSTWAGSRPRRRCWPWRARARADRTGTPCGLRGSGRRQLPVAQVDGRRGPEVQGPLHEGQEQLAPQAVAVVVRVEQVG